MLLHTAGSRSAEQLGIRLSMRPANESGSHPHILAAAYLRHLAGLWESQLQAAGQRLLSSCTALARCRCCLESLVSPKLAWLGQLMRILAQLRSAFR